MKPLRDIIVKVEEAYKDSITLDNGVEILLNQTFKQVKDTIRYGQIFAVPDNCPLDVKVGDTLFFHHGIVAETVIGEGVTNPSPYLFDGENKLYRVPINDRWPMAFAVVRGGEFRCLEGVCFIKPIVTKKYNSKHLIIPDNEQELKNVGEIEYPSPKQKEESLDKGTKVVFEKDSEYEFEIGGNTLYCMFDRWILGIYEGE